MAKAVTTPEEEHILTDEEFRQQIEARNKELVEIRIYRKPGNTRKGVFVSVNNDNFFVPYGQTVKVPRSIAEVLKWSTERDDATETRIDEMAAEYEKAH